MRTEDADPMTCCFIYRNLLSSFDMSQRTDTTSSFIEDYMILKLEEFGFDRPDLLGLHCLNRNRCPPQRTLQYFAEESSAILINLDLEDTLAKLHISKDSLLTTFLFLADALFGEDVLSWWKIVALIDLASQMAVMCVDRELPTMVASILSWTIRYMENRNVRHWIEENGGWEKLMSYEEHGLGH